MVMKLAGLFALASLSLGSPVTGQTVLGSVVRAQGRTPIVNALIAAKRARGTTTSDRLGRFSIRLGDLPDTLVIAAIGFAPDTVAIATLPDQRLTIAMGDAPVVISDLIAVAHADPSLDLASQGRWEMPIEAARSVPPAVETDVYRAIALIPAASFTSPLSARPMIRGYDAQEVTTRIDGFEVLNLFHLGRLFSSYPADAAEAINVSVAPYSSSQGGSIAGLIDIVGRTGPEGDLVGGGGASWGSVSAYAGGGSAKIRTFVNARFFHLGALRLIPGVEIPYHFEDLYAGAVFGPANKPKGRITLFGTQDRAGKASHDNFLNWDNLVLGTRWRLLDRGATSIELSTAAARFSEDGNEVPGLRTLGAANLKNRFARIALNGDLVTTGRRTRGAAGFSVGWRSVENRIEPTDPDLGTVPTFQAAQLNLGRAELAGYAEVTRRFGPFGLEVAVRADRAGSITSVQPRLHALWMVAPRIELGAGLGRTSRLFHLLADSRSEPDFDFLDFWVNAGDSVPMARVDHATLDLTIDLSPVVARVSGYTSGGHGVGEVRPSHDQRPRPFDFFRFGRSRTRGVEAQIAYRGSAGHPHSLSLSYVLAESDRNWGEGWVRWAQDRRHQARLFGQLQLGRLTLMTAVEASTGMPATAAPFWVVRDLPNLPTETENPFDNIFPVYGPENGVKTSGTFRTDAGFNLTLGRPGKRRTVLGVGIINLFQTEVAPITGDGAGRGRFATARDGQSTSFRRLFTLPGIPTVTIRIEL